MAQPAAKPQNFRCPACGAEYETKEQLDDHGKKDHPKK